MMPDRRPGDGVPSAPVARHANNRASGLPELLVLDLGGVLFPSAMPGIVADVASDLGVDRERVRRHVDTALLHALWSGEVSIDVFWARIASATGAPLSPARRARWASRVAARMRPLPALRCLPVWSRHVRIGILSNHRAEWARPALARAGVLDLLDPVLISSETGCVKPDADAFAQLARLGVAPSRILYVDDRAAARRGAARVGVRTRAADPAGRWASDLGLLLAGAVRAPTG